MDTFREEGSISRAPLLDGQNYAYWKAKMGAFIRSIDHKTWKSVVTGWEAPKKLLSDGITSVKKSEVEWSPTEDEAALYNSKALNAIYNGVDRNVFRLINTCESAKEAWDILETTYEGTDKVKNSRLQLVTTKFENMKMYEEETISEFYVRIRDLSNESHALGEPMSDAKLVKKILRSLPERFKIKVTTIDEVHDTSEMKVDELIGSLLTYEMSFADSSEKKHRGLALKTTSAEPESPKMEGSSESYDESLALMVKNYGKLMKRFERRSPNTPSQSNPSHNREKTPQNYKPGSFNKKGREDRSNPFGSKAKGIQCRECEGFGHIQA